VSNWTELAGRWAGQAALAPVWSALARGQSATLDGAWGSAAGLAVAALQTRAQGPVLVVLAHPADEDGWFGDLATFTGQPPLVFPAIDGDPADDTAAQRLRVLKALRSTTPPATLLTTIQALMRPLPAPSTLAEQARQLRVGDDIAPDDLIAWLIDHGFTRRELVELPGEFTRRGGIVDVFPPDAEAPFRIEFFGDTIDSLRTFAAETQRSLEAVSAVEITGLNVGGAVPVKGRSVASLVDYLPDTARIVLVELSELREQARHFLDRLADVRGWFSVDGVFQHLIRRPTLALSALPAESAEVSGHLRVESVERFSGDAAKVFAELATIADRADVILACPTAAETHRLGELFREKAPDQRPPRFLEGQVRAGFRLVDEGVLVLSAADLFHREAAPARRSPTRKYETRAIDSFLDLNEGDLVVHINHGIARFLGMQVLDGKGQFTEHLTLEFSEGTKLYVPVDKIDLVQKYVGGGTQPPELSKLGGTLWQKRKERVQEAVLDLAAEMIDLQARRATQPGVAAPPDTPWQREFEAAFPYQETPDQLAALADIKGDLERPRPMDRLLCGDVGFGKTELAVRAAFKLAEAGKQVAVLVPTTILAEQHYRTFSQRFAEYPFAVACLSRFRSAGQQKQIIQELAAGKIDVVIGTHRLLSKDVKFKDLGLVIIDEEQRFGVEHKERLKQFRASVDVLTLSATPIPRTLHMSLLGIRDISSLETPPRDRLAVETRIIRFDPTLIRHAILRELNREGQVIFVHNRVYDIKQTMHKLQEIAPEARYGFGHGQMAEHELEATMVRFLQREIDVLVATTIIENGVDIPTVNTIFIDQADQYGLADLHQLRGRVGRYKHRAYCYLLLEPGRALTEVAAKRLKAIEEFNSLGAGFKIAMRDLEIRGAGNILGTEQSGHIAAVGYELYCQLLETAVRRLKKQPVRAVLDVAIDLPLPAYLPRDYVPGQKAKIEVYRRLARIRKLERLVDFRQELADRFGAIPEPTENLIRLHELRLLAARWQVASIHMDEQDVVLGYRDRAKIEHLAVLSGPVPRLRHQPAEPGNRLRIVDDHAAYFRLRRPEEKTPAGLLALLHDLLAGHLAAPAPALAHAAR
jgi:transcription-repair coupling factor (superfamily II helicase)